MEDCTEQKSILAQIGYEQVWEHTTVLPALGRPRNEDYEFGASLGYKGNFFKKMYSNIKYYYVQTERCTTTFPLATGRHSTIMIAFAPVSLRSLNPSED